MRMSVSEACSVLLGCASGLAVTRIGQAAQRPSKAAVLLSPEQSHPPGLSRFRPLHLADLAP